MDRRNFLRLAAAMIVAPTVPLPSPTAPSFVSVSLATPQRYFTLMELARMNPVSPTLIASLTEPNPLLNLLSFKEIHGS